jgi:hypothetical protein
VKSNPLFVDSTRFHGDAIMSQFELRQVLIFDGETVFVAVSPHKGDFRRIAMRPQDDGSFGTKVSLHHQTLISYRFEIEKDGLIIMTSRDYRTRVQYAIISDWKPQGLETEVPESPVETGDQQDWPRGQVASIRSMIDKFGF